MTEQFAESARREGMNLDLDFIDYPTGWAIQRTGDLKHVSECSAAQTGGAMLCDCKALVYAWAELKWKHERTKAAGEAAHQRTGWALYNELVDRHNVERLHLQAVISELKDLLSRACAQDATEDCWLDHNGGCQAHGFLSGACPYPLIRQYVDPTYSPGQAD